MSVTILGSLPDPFLKEDGSRMTPEEWYQNRKAVFDKICDIEYGVMPPKPEVVKMTRISALSTGTSTMVYKLYIGTKDKQIAMLMDVSAPEGKRDGSQKFPVMLTGDGCFRYCESPIIAAAHERGIAVARFNRLEFAHDDMTQERVGGLYDLYPEYKEFTAIAAWAWGYSACIDALSQLPYIDTENIGITGHSRGGKTVLLAAAYDERVKYVGANNSGTHGANSYRLKETGLGWANKSEDLNDMFKRFPLWMSEKQRPYIDNEDKLPYDMHFFGALIAPRFYLQCEGMQDYWINPKGAWMNFCGVKEAYRYLGCEDNAAAWFREGSHRHGLPDFAQFFDFMVAKMNGKPTAEHLKINPYPDLDVAPKW